MKIQLYELDKCVFNPTIETFKHYLFNYSVYSTDINVGETIEGKYPLWVRIITRYSYSGQHTSRTTSMGYYFILDDGTKIGVMESIVNEEYKNILLELGMALDSYTSALYREINAIIVNKIKSDDVVHRPEPEGNTV